MTASEPSFTTLARRPSAFFFSHAANCPSIRRQGSSRNTFFWGSYELSRLPLPAFNRIRSSELQARSDFPQSGLAYFRRPSKCHFLRLSSHFYGVRHRKL